MVTPSTPEPICARRPLDWPQRRETAPTSSRSSKSLLSSGSRTTEGMAVLGGRTAASSTYAVIRRAARHAPSRETASGVSTCAMPWRSALPTSPVARSMRSDVAAGTSVGVAAEPHQVDAALGGDGGDGLDGAAGDAGVLVDEADRVAAAGVLGDEVVEQRGGGAGADGDRRLAADAAGGVRQPAQPGLVAGAGPAEAAGDAEVGGGVVEGQAQHHRAHQVVDGVRVAGDRDQRVLGEVGEHGHVAQLVALANSSATSRRVARSPPSVIAPRSIAGHGADAQAGDQERLAGLASAPTGRGRGSAARVRSVSASG